ncbi:MAG: hypothetical protein WBD99_06485 [Thermodesulfobacteriota bacterium]
MDNILQLDIQKKFTVRDIEDLIRQVYNSQAEKVQIRLPRNLEAKFFNRSWIVSLLATVARDRMLYVTDWGKVNTDVEDALPRFETHVEGLASLEYAAKIQNEKEEKIDLDVIRIKKNLSMRDGIAEMPDELRSSKHHQGRFNYITFCAFDNNDPDHNYPFPKALFSITNSRGSFINNFNKFTRNFLIHLHKFERGKAFGYSTPRDIRDALEDLAEFVFEIFENTHEHGCWNRENELIKGLRYVHLKRHHTNDKYELIGRAKGFSELEEYLNKTIPARKVSTFYEISISDNGIGIIDRFMTTKGKELEEKGLEKLGARHAN